MAGLAVLALLLGAAGCEPDDRPTCSCPAGAVLACGHRGTGANGERSPEPENTLPSFRKAEEEGADLIELDVQHAADGQLVVIHDDRVDRTTDATGCVGDYTAAELQTLDAARGTPMAGQGVTIPTLDEVLGAVRIGVNIEIKMNDDPGCPASDATALAADVVAAVGRARSADPDRYLMVSSFDLDVVSRVETADPQIRTALISLVSADAARAAAAGLDALNVFALLGITQSQVDAIRDTGVEANVWTINVPADMRTLLPLGVGMIITDEPDLLIEARAAVCLAQCR